MKLFEIITESDARTLEPGSSVRLARGGHITPLAIDTLRSLGVTVLREDVGAGDDAHLAPPALIGRVAVASDHTGVALKKIVVEYLREQGLAVTDLGTHTTDAVDYPDTSEAVACAVASGEADAGVVIDGAGLGSAIVANKIPGVRAAMCNTPTLARYSRQHNGANVLSLGASLLSPEEALTILDLFITTPMTEPRYVRRLAKIRRVEQRGRA